MDIWQLLATWAHTVAFVIAWGYYGILGRVMLPAFEQSLDGRGQAGLLVEVERRARPLVLGSTVLFVLTGTYLLVIDPQYTGLGDFFANTWSTLMAVKHLVVIALVALAIALDVWIRRLSTTTDESTRATTVRRVRWGAELVTGLGALMVFLTAAAQLAG